MTLCIALAATSARAAATDEPVQLSVFEVSSDAVRGYATTSSTSASRIAVLFGANGGFDFAFVERVENVFDHFDLRPSNNETAVGVTNHRNHRLSVETNW